MKIAHIVFAMMASASTVASANECESYSLDLSAVLQRAFGTTVATCSSQYTKHEGEVKFTLHGFDGKDYTVVCDPIECKAPSVVK